MLILWLAVIPSPSVSGGPFLSTWNVSRHAEGLRLPPWYEMFLPENSGNTHRILAPQPPGGSRCARARRPRLWFSRFARLNSAPNKDAERRKLPADSFGSSKFRRDRLPGVDHARHAYGAGNSTSFRQECRPRPR